ncbi:UNVERIFIED_ORG: hypothetical protein GGI63_005241 [Rhizobium esperanzae]
MEELLSGAAGVVLGWMACRMGWKDRTESLKSIAKQLDCNVDEAEMRYLEVLRREIAQEIMSDDADAMYRAFHKTRDYERELRRGDKARIDADFKSLCHKVPAFQDFDVLGTRHFVAYPDARSSLSTEDLVDNYLDITRMLIINAARKATPHEVTGGDEADQLDKAIRRRKDRAFKARIIDAVERYHSYNNARSKEGLGRRGYDDGKLFVTFVLPEYSPEHGYGVHFADTGEYGLNTVYVDDNGKPFRSYYRSDASFKEQRGLDT